MKKSSTVFLQVVIVIIGIVALIVMIRFPLTEGRAVNLDLFSIYTDPFIIYGYVVSIAFFVALWEAYKLLGYIGQNKVFSLSSVKALRTIKYCAIIISVMYVAGMPFLVSVADKDDAPGAVGFGLIFILVSIVVATFAAVLQKLVQSGLDMKSKNDLTV